jgi:hypothetical protein
VRSASGQPHRIASAAPRPGLPIALILPVKYVKAITAAERLFSGVDDLVWLRRGSLTQSAAETWILPEVLQQLRDDVFAEILQQEAEDGIDNGQYRPLLETIRLSFAPAGLDVGSAAYVLLRLSRVSGRMRFEQQWATADCPHIPETFVPTEYGPLGTDGNRDSRTLSRTGSLRYKRPVRMNISSPGRAKSGSTRSCGN